MCWKEEKDNNNNNSVKTSLLKQVPRRSPDMRKTGKIPEQQIEFLLNWNQRYENRKIMTFLV